MCKLTLFGAPALECNGRPRYISRRKARALLAYLAVIRQRHTREELVAFLWPEYGERKGRADLSRMLTTLRNALDADYFLTDRESVALNEEADLWVDVAHFRRLVDACRESDVVGLDEDCYQKLVTAADLYQADFLAGFTLPDCPPFDEWQLLQSEALRRDLGWALDKLAHASETSDDLAQAIDYARRWVALDPLHEQAQRRLMALYARNGKRAAALRQYQACVRVLEEELGVEPQPETKALHEQIRTSNAKSPLIADRSQMPESGEGPPFEWPEPQPEREHPFVARSHELAQLNSYLDGMLDGNGRVVFVIGGAGWGKTSLLEEFAYRAQDGHKDLIVAGGNGNAFAGVGDPYLPFREVMSQLTGDVGTQSRVGAMSREQARRLWSVLPETAQAIVDHGPQLLDVFVSGKQLLARATTAAPAGAEWLVALQLEVNRRQDAPGHFQQTALFGQFSNVLRNLAQKRPLLIILDDLQWIDDASVGLLFHMGRSLPGSRIMIVGAYRPDELPRERNGEPHPLPQLLDEFRRRYGDVFIDLARPDRTRGREFINALLDSEPNRLDGAFRQALLRQTGGHPLFTVELLRDMQNRGDLVKDKAGQWCEGSELDWQTFPVRVEAVIARRIGRLDDDVREILTIASVEGERFTAEVVARVLGREERPLLRTLSELLEKRHRLVREQGEVEVGREYLSSYRFSHVLFQRYLYQQLPSGERRRLHGEVVAALAELHADDLDQVVVQLAHHYRAAADWDKAVPHWSRAGDLAYQKASLQEAARHYQAALDHWPEDDKGGRAETFRKVGECLWVLGRHEDAKQALQASDELSRSVGDHRGAGASQRLLGRIYWELGQQSNAEQCYQRALTILEVDEDSEEYGWALATMATYQMQIGNYDQSIDIGRRALALARKLDAEALIIQCLCDLGSALSGKGDWVGLDMEQESLDRALVSNRAHDAGRAYSYLAEGLFYMGRYEEVRLLLNEASAYSQRMYMPFFAVATSLQIAELDWITGRWSDAHTRAQSLLDRGRTQETAGLVRFYLAHVLGRIYNDLGKPKRARERLTGVLGDDVDRLDPRLALLGELARAEALMGRPAEAAAAAAGILEWTDQARYLYPNVGMALLFICRAPVAYGYPAMAGHARSAWQQLQRLDRQYRTPVTAACRLEGQGWLLLAEDDSAKAAKSFEEAIARWQSAGRPYDRVRAFVGLSRALFREGDRQGARAALEQATRLVDSLVEQLEDPALKRSFLDSALVREIGELKSR